MSTMFPVLAVLLACVGDVGEGKVAAEVADAPAAPAEKAPASAVAVMVPLPKPSVVTIRRSPRCPEEPRKASTMASGTP